MGSPCRAGDAGSSGARASSGGSARCTAIWRFAAARVSGTPTFIINDEETIVGMKSYEEWRDRPWSERVVEKLGFFLRRHT